MFLFMSVRTQYSSFLQNDITDFHLTIYFFSILSDDEAPTLNCTNVTFTADIGKDFSSTVMINPAAYDNVDGDLNVSCSHTSNDTFWLGNTEVNCSAIDSAGNTATCLFLVTVTGKIFSCFFFLR